MNKKKIFLIPILFLFSIGCWDTEPDVCLDVPYIQQEQEYYCTVACIQMWARYDGNYADSQDDIAGEIGAPTSLERARYGIDMFTRSTGHLYQSVATNMNQDRLIAMSIAGFQAGCPSIMPVMNGNHAIIVIGYESHTDESGSPVADVMYYHNPTSYYYGGYEDANAYELKHDVFTTIQSTWYAILLGNKSFVGQGFNGYNEFLNKGGTFYGGPDQYDPTVYVQ